MKKFFILYCFAALVLSSCGGDAVVINEGTLYRIITDKDEGFGRFTRTSGSYWRGTYYRETEGALNASARDVVFRNGRRPSMESADGEKFRVESITEYEPPRCKEYPFATDYRDSVFSVTELHDITYAKAYGYWSSFPDNGRSNLAIFMSRVPDLSKSDLDLTMDVYLPEDGGKVLRPLLILIHGGAFFNGDKASLGFPGIGQLPSRIPPEHDFSGESRLQGRAGCQLGDCLHPTRPGTVPGRSRAGVPCRDKRRRDCRTQRRLHEGREHPQIVKRRRRHHGRQRRYR